MQMARLCNWSSAAGVFVHVLATTTIICVSQTFSQAATTVPGPGVLLTQRPQAQAGDLGGFTSTQWNVFPGCVQCVCRQDQRLINCTGKMMSNGRLPDAESLPRNDVQT